MYMRKSEEVLLEFVREHNIPIKDVLTAIGDYAKEFAKYYGERKQGHSLEDDLKEKQYWDGIKDDVEDMLQDPYMIRRKLKGWDK